MVSRTEVVLNLFETKAKREVWLDRYAASNMSIDLFCEMNHIKKRNNRKRKFNMRLRRFLIEILSPYS